MTHRLIVPLDQSAVAESALPLARGLAKQLNANVTLISVLDVPPSFGHYVRAPQRELVTTTPARFPSDATPQSPYGNWTGWRDSEPSARQIEEISKETAAAERYLEAIAETFDIEHVEKVVRLGRPAERILHLAETREGAIIVLASHGRTGLGRAIVGSVAERVVQATRSPVFVVRATQDAKGAGTADPIRKVLIPVDGSAFSEQAIPVVTDLLRSNEMTAHLIHIIETPRFANMAQSEGYTNWLAERVSESGIPATAEVMQGWSPGDQINKAAERLDVDLIAMSTHGRTGLDRFVLGSVVERVLHNAERPLLVVPARV